MNPESEAWRQLRDEAAGCLRPGFAERAVRAARAIVGPSLLSQFAFCAATAAACLTAILIFQSHQGQSDRNQSLAEWQQVATATDDFSAQ